MSHRRDAERAEKKFFYKKPLRTLRLCGDSMIKWTEFFFFSHVYPPQAD